MKKLVPKKKVVEKTVEKRVDSVAQKSNTGNLSFQVGVKDEVTGDTYKYYDIRGLTGADEEELAKPEYRSNKGKFINVILSRCITHIGPYDKKTLGFKKWYEVIQSLVIADQDLALMEIRKKLTGDNITTESMCPACSARLKTEMSIDEFPIKPYLGETEWENDLPDGVEINGEIHTHYTMRLPNGLDRELYMPVAEKNAAKGTTLLLSRLATFEGVVTNAETFRNMTLSDRKYMEDDLNEHNFGYELIAEVECPECGESYKIAVGNVNFT